MSNPQSIEDKFLALRELGVGEFAHLNGSLEAHLLGTYELLSGWGNPEHVCSAGLYHAVYGTQPMKELGLPHKEYSPSDRPKIRKVIGVKAEALVYLYGACDRDFFYPQIGSPKPIYRDRFIFAEKVLPLVTMSNLLEITIANELEICIGSPTFMKQHREWFVELFNRFEGLVSTNAYELYLNTFKA